MGVVQGVCRSVKLHGRTRAHLANKQLSYLIVLCLINMCVSACMNVCIYSTACLCAVLRIRHINQLLWPYLLT